MDEEFRKSATDVTGFEWLNEGGEGRHPKVTSTNLSSRPAAAACQLARPGATTIRAGLN